MIRVLFVGSLGFMQFSLLFPVFAFSFLRISRSDFFGYGFVTLN